MRAPGTLHYVARSESRCAASFREASPEKELSQQVIYVIFLKFSDNKSEAIDRQVTLVLPI